MQSTLLQLQQVGDSYLVAQSQNQEFDDHQVIMLDVDSQTMANLQLSLVSQ